MCDYILGTNHRLLKILGIRDMSNYSSYHLSLKALLLQHPTRYHVRYLQARRAFPLSLPAASYLSVVETKFQALKDLYNPPPPPLKLPLSSYGWHRPPSS